MARQSFSSSDLLFFPSFSHFHHLPAVFTHLHFIIIHYHFLHKAKQQLTAPHYYYPKNRVQAKNGGKIKKEKGQTVSAAACLYSILMRQAGSYVTPRRRNPNSCDEATPAGPVCPSINMALQSCSTAGMRHQILKGAAHYFATQSATSADCLSCCAEGGQGWVQPGTEGTKGLGDVRYDDWFL